MSQSSDTPETNEAIWVDDYGVECINANFARELERQRDAAREDARRLAEQLKYLAECVEGACWRKAMV